ncbi:6-bladed beta-propeller [Barnesiella intestinihominis]|uniref:6-bladed beta-propeller n=1 Tax=Barnesiella intestinihominis TaxID=487174 RepID=UPI003AB70E81
MMNIQHAIWTGICIVFVVITACTSSFEKKESNEEVITVLNSTNPLQVDLKDMVDSIEYIVLETTDSCLLSDILCVKRDGAFYFVRDTKGLYVFDGEGKFLNEISRRGPGPEEYIYLDNFYLDRERKHVCLILSAQKRILQYSYRGEYIGTITLEARSSGLSYARVDNAGNLIAYYPLRNDGNKEKNGYGLLRLDNSGIPLTVEPLLPGIEIATGNVHYPFLHYPVAQLGDGYFLATALSDVLTFYRPDSSLRSYRVGLPDIAPDKKFLARYADTDFFKLLDILKGKGIGCGITAVESVAPYLFLSIGNESTLIWDMQEAVWVSFFYDSDLNRYAQPVLSGGISDEHWGFYTADFLCEHRDKFRKKSGTVVAWIDKLTAEDNPVIFKYHFKSDLIGRLKKKIKSES